MCVTCPSWVLLQAPRGLQVMVQESRMCSAAFALSWSALGSLPPLDKAPVLFWLPRAFAGWGVAAFCPCSGVFQGCLQRAVPGRVWWHLCSGRRTIWRYAQTQRGVCLGGSLRGWQSSSTVSRLAPGLALGTSVDVCASMSRHSHAAEKGPCETLPS